MMQSDVFKCSEGILSRNKGRENPSLPSIELGPEFAKVSFLIATWWRNIFLLLLIVFYISLVTPYLPLYPNNCFRLMILIVASSPSQISLS